MLLNHADTAGPRRTILALLAVLLLASTASTASAGDGQCSDPCIMAARLARQACLASAAGAFVDDVTGCVERLPECVAACRADHQDCRDATSLGLDLAACQAALTADLARCRVDHPPGSIRLAVCIERSRIRGGRCRRGAIRSVRQELKACRADRRACVRACGPGTPPGGPGPCRTEARDAFRTARQSCKAEFRATAQGCLDKEIGCVQDCGATRDACDAAAGAILDPMLAACRAARDAAVSACRAAHPDGGEGLDECMRSAQANASACREVALESAAPALAACVTAYAGCVRGCPSL